MLDPGLEHMHRHGRLWRASVARARVISHAALEIVLVPPALLLLWLAPTQPWGPAWLVALLVGAFAVTSVVRFEIGSGSTSPLQLIVVPLWFVVPPGWLVIVIAGGFVLGGVLEHVREAEPRPLWQVPLQASDAWPAFGPAVVFAIAGSPDASMDAASVVAAAFAAQVVVDLAFGVLSPWYIHGIRPAVQIRLMAWITAVDAALAPIGFLTAVLMVTQPLAALALLPLIALIAEFARERTERLDQALQLSNAYRGTAQLMGDVLETDDAYTGGEHTQGVVGMAVAVGLEMRLPPRLMRDLEFGALLHDIGKLRVPNDIINKPGALDAAEWEVIRKHPEYGQQMLDRVGGAMVAAGEIVRSHHERWDGTGYPDRLRGDQIPIAARIITACDSLSAMTTTRSYSPAMPKVDAVAELRRCAGTQFDPAVVTALLGVLERDPSLLAAGTRVSVGISPVAAAAGLRTAY